MSYVLCKQFFLLWSGLGFNLKIQPFFFICLKLMTLSYAFLCSQGSKLATLPRPHSAVEVLFINCMCLCLILVLLFIAFYIAFVLIWFVKYAVPRGVLYGCGDLIFSSHMIFTLVFVRTYQKYGTRR